MGKLSNIYLLWLQLRTSSYSYGGFKSSFHSSFNNSIKSSSKQYKRPHHNLPAVQAIQAAIPAFRSAGWTYQQIATHLHLTLRQVQHAATPQATPRRSTGRPPITEAQPEELIES